MIGNLFSIAISCALRFFLAVIGNQAPALTVASFATTTHCLPLIYPIFTTTPPDGHPPCETYIPSPAKAPTSMDFEFESKRYSTRSRAVSFPLACSFSILDFPPPNLTCDKRLFKSVTRSLL